MIEFSVIIPLYNKETAIEDTMRSVLQQSYPDFEVIVVDDGSKDNSANIVHSFDDKRIYYYWKENGGVSSARNYGIQHSSKEWLIFLDGDDLLEPDALQTFVKLMDIFPCHNVYLGNMKLWNCLRCRKMDDFGHISTNPYRDWWKMRLAPEMGVFTMRRSLIEQIGFFDERISLFEDLDFTSRLMDIETFVYTSFPIKEYREQFSTLSVVAHPLEKEFAFYIDEKRVKGSIWKKMVMAFNIWDTRRHHYNARDWGGAHFYSMKMRKLFPWYILLYFYYRELRQRLGNMKRHFFRKG